MIRYFKNKDIDYTLWDQCVEKAIQGDSLYAHSWYLDIVSPNWDAIILVQDCHYLVVFPICHKTILFHKFIFQPFFTQQLGFFSTTALTKTVVEEILTLLSKKYKDITLCLNEHNNSIREHIPENFNLTKNTNLLLDLHASYDDLFQHFSKRSKKIIKDHEVKKEIQVFESKSIDTLNTLFKHEVGKKIPEFKAYHYTLIKNIYIQLHKRGQATILVAQQNEKTIAAALFLQYRSQIINLYNATNEEGKKTGAITLLFNEMIRKNCKSSSVLDFKGSNIGSIASFFKNFGAQPVNYLTLQTLKLPFYIKLFRK